MVAKNYQGEVKARIVEARFAMSGKVSVVKKYTGDAVKKGDLLASLDRKILQTELDRQLADYEKVRADFEIFAKKSGEPAGEIDQYLKTQKQASLNASVKDVELAKAKMDMSDLFSPVAGIILDDSNMVAGIYITPASSSFKIIDTGSFYLEIEIENDEAKKFDRPRKAKVKLPGMEAKISAETTPVFSNGKKLIIKIPLPEKERVLIGLNGQVNF